MSNEGSSLALVPVPAPKLNNLAGRLVSRERQPFDESYVPHLGIDQVQLLARVAETLGRGDKGERDRLLIETLFDVCLRVSEALALRPVDLVQSPAGWAVRILGKGSRHGTAAISSSLAARLQSYAYRTGLAPDAHLFPFTRARAFQIIQRALEASGVAKPDGVGSVHVLRHSGAIERLRATGTPKAVQDQLRHQSARMTLRYMKTLAMEESLAINQGVDFGW